VDPSVECVPGAAALLKPVAEDARATPPRRCSRRAVPVRSRTLGADVDANLDAIRADHPLDVDCRAGCDACCHPRVYVSPVEAFAMVRALRVHSSERTRGGSSGARGRWRSRGMVDRYVRAAKLLDEDNAASGMRRTHAQMRSRSLSKTLEPPYEARGIVTEHDDVPCGDLLNPMSDEPCEQVSRFEDLDTADVLSRRVDARDQPGDRIGGQDRSPAKDARQGVLDLHLQLEPARGELQLQLEVLADVIIIRWAVIAPGDTARSYAIVPAGHQVRADTQRRELLHGGRDPTRPLLLDRHELHLPRGLPVTGRFDDLPIAAAKRVLVR